MVRGWWTLIKNSVFAFIEDEALSRGAAMAFYAVTSLAPILLIVIAIAGLVFGHDAAQAAIIAQMSGLMGKSSADMLQSAIQSASGTTSGTLGTIIGVIMLLVTASGVFGEMQSALNAIWKTKSKASTTSRLIRARAASLGLVCALGFLLIISLVMSAGIAAVGDIVTGFLPFGKLILGVLDVLISFLLLAVMFAAIYKLLPDRKLEWRDVIVGACVTSALFSAGKSLIGWYLGSSSVASESVRKVSRWITQFPKHEANGREAYESHRHGGQVLEILGEAAAPIEPCERPLDNPSAWQDLEPLRIRALYDLDGKTGQSFGQGIAELRTLIPAVGEQLFKEWIQAEHGRHNKHASVTVLNVRRMNDRVQQQTYRVDQDMPLLSLDFLARVIAIWINAAPPFSALFTLWLSITQAVGLASRPICSRHSM